MTSWSITSWLFGGKETDALRIRCLVEGDDRAVSVTIPLHHDISMLSKRIHKAAKQSLANVDAKDLTLFKVQVNLDNLDDNSLRSLAATQEVKNATKLSPGWKAVSEIWKAQPPANMLSVFVKVRPPTVLQFRPANSFLATIVAVDNGVLRDPIEVEIPSTAMIHELPDLIIGGLRKHALVGRSFETGLAILPLRRMPSLSDLQTMDLAELRRQAQDPNHLPDQKSSEFFSLQKSDAVHFLVWLPRSQKERFPQSTSLQWLVKICLLKILDFEGVSVASESSDNSAAMKFKDALKDAYEHPSSRKLFLFDMATGRQLRQGSVVPCHIFQHRWRKYLPSFSSIEDIDDPENGLLLYKPVQWAFDRAALCIEIKEGDFTFRLLDSRLRPIKLSDKADELRRLRKSNGDGEEGEEDDDADANLSMTFGDLDGTEVSFPPGCPMRPSKRLLSLHAYAAWLYADAIAPNSKILPPNYDMSIVSEDELTQNNFLREFVSQWRAEANMAAEDLEPDQLSVFSVGEIVP